MRSPTDPISSPAHALRRAEQRAALIAELTPRAGSLRHQQIRLWAALRSRDIEEVEATLRAGVSPRFSDPAGHPMLAVALRSRKSSDQTDRGREQSLACARLLLAAFERDGRGGKQQAIQRAMEVAAHEGNAQAARELRAAGASPNAFPKSAQSPWLLAARYGRAQSIQTLLDLGVDIQERTVDGRCALALAMEHGREEAIVELLRAGLDPLDMRGNGLSPLERARHAGHGAFAARAMSRFESEALDVGLAGAKLAPRGAARI